MAEQPASKHTVEQDEEKKQPVYAGVGLILGSGAGFALGGVMGAGMGAALGLLLGAALDSRKRQQQAEQ